MAERQQKTGPDIKEEEGVVKHKERTSASSATTAASTAPGSSTLQGAAGGDAPRKNGAAKAKAIQKGDKLFRGRFICIAG